jgi:mono/diheme cytochrome c family protein
VLCQLRFARAFPPHSPPGRGHFPFWRIERRELAWVPMPRRLVRLVLLPICLLIPRIAARETVSGTPQNANKGAAKLPSQTERTSSLDLEISGSLAGLPAGSKRFLRHEDLLALPQVSFTVTDDPNFSGPTEVRGVELDLLARELGSEGGRAFVVAVCRDWYRAHYPQAYREVHKPVLVLEINGQLPPDWPKSKEGTASPMGPYLITHAHFTPSFKILAHEDEAQIPWGVVALEFLNEKAALAGIEPQGATADAPEVQAGYRIAQQNCFRCHGPANLGSLKGKLTWDGIALFASQAPKNFAAYVRNPKSVVPNAEMPPNPEYDEPTLEALAAYFGTFAPTEKK